MLSKQEKRKVQNRNAQRAFRLRKSMAKAEHERNAITRCEASSQQACADTSSPIEIDPVPNLSPKFIASPFLYSSQEEQQVQIHEQPTYPISRVNSQSDRGIQGFVQAPVADEPIDDGSPDGWLSGQFYGNMEQNDLSNPYWVDAPQSGPSYDFHGVAQSTKTLHAQPRSENPLLGIMCHAMRSMRRVDKARIGLQRKNVKHSMKVSDHSVDMMRMELDLAILE